MAMSSPKHQVWTTYGTEVGIGSPRSSRSSSVRARSPAAPGRRVRSASTARSGAGSSGSSRRRNLPAIRPVSGVRPDLRGEQPIDLGRRRGAVLLGVVEVAPRLGIGVGPAADDGDRHGAGRLPLDLVAGVSGPLGADLVELAPQRRAMAGVTEQHGADLARRVDRRQHGQARVDRPVRIDAEPDPLPLLEHPAVGREAGPALAPRQARRLAVRQRRQRDLLDRVGQLAGITLDPLGLVGGERLAEDERPARCSGPGRSAYASSRPRTAPASARPSPSAGPRPPRSSSSPMAQLSTATRRGPPPAFAVIAADRQRPGLEPAGDPLRLRLAGSRSPPSGSGNPG